MKRILVYLFILLSLGLTINTHANEIKFKQLKISTKNEIFKKFGSDIRGNIEGMDFINRFYEYTDGNNLKGLIEIFNFDNSGQYEGRVNQWFRGLTFRVNSDVGCNKSNKSIFFESIDLDTHVSCLSIREINQDELSSPNFSKNKYINFSSRKPIIKKFIKKRQILLPEKMIRAEHYFYKAGQITWIFYSITIDINSEDEINKFVNQTFQNHKIFGEQLKIKKKTQLSFKDVKIDKKTLVVEKKESNPTLELVSDTKKLSTDSDSEDFFIAKNTYKPNKKYKAKTKEEALAMCKKDAPNNDNAGNCHIKKTKLKLFTKKDKVLEQEKTKILVTKKDPNPTLELVSDTEQFVFQNQITNIKFIASTKKEALEKCKKESQTNNTARHCMQVSSSIEQVSSSIDSEDFFIATNAYSSHSSLKEYKAKTKEEALAICKKDVSNLSGINHCVIKNKSNQNFGVFTVKNKKFPKAGPWRHSKKEKAIRMCWDLTPGHGWDGTISMKHNDYEANKINCYVLSDPTEPELNEIKIAKKEKEEQKKTKKKKTKFKLFTKKDKVLEQEKTKILVTKKDVDAPILIVDENITVNNSSYSFIVRAEDKGSDKIFIQVNGAYSQFKDGVFEVKRFSPIDEKITLVATDEWGNQSLPKIINIKVKRENIIAKNKIEKLNPSKLNVKTSDNNVAIIIGIENYAQSPKATFANLDAKYFYEYALKGFGVKEENIKLMVDKDATFFQSLGILSKWLPSRIKAKETNLIIFFAGHGLASNDGKDLFLLSQDSDPDLLTRTALSRTELFKEIIALNPKSVTMFLDTCYSGVSRDEKTLLASARPVRIVADEQETPNNFTIFSASQLDQISSGFKEAKHGIFSYYLMKGLEGKADANNDKDITNGELLAYMNENVAQRASQLGRQQNPSLAGDPDKILMSYR